MSAQFTDAAFDAAQAMNTVTRSITGKPISPQAAADGLEKLTEVAAGLTAATRALAWRFRLTAHGGNPTATEPIVDGARAVVDFLRDAASESSQTRDALVEARGEMQELARTVRGTTFTV